MYAHQINQFLDFDRALALRIPNLLRRVFNLVGKGTNWTWYYSYPLEIEDTFQYSELTGKKRSLAAAISFIDQNCPTKSVNLQVLTTIIVMVFVSRKKIPLSFNNNLCGQLVRTNGIYPKGFWLPFLKLQSHVDIYMYIPGMENYSSCFLVNDKLLQTKLLWEDVVP